MEKEIRGEIEKNLTENWISSGRSLSEVEVVCLSVCLSVCCRPSNPNLKLSAIRRAYGTKPEEQCNAHSHHTRETSKTSAVEVEEEEAEEGDGESTTS